MSGSSTPQPDVCPRTHNFKPADLRHHHAGRSNDNGLARHALFARLLQALIELAPAGSEERALLESLSNHIAARAGLAASRQAALGLEAPA